MGDNYDLNGITSSLFHFIFKIFIFGSNNLKSAMSLKISNDIKLDVYI